MASQRLRQLDRDNIVKRLMIHKFRARAEELVKVHHQLAEAVYEDLFSKAHRDLMVSLPGGWLTRSSYIRVQIRGDVEMLHFNGNQVLPSWDLNQLTVRQYTTSDHLMPHFADNGIAHSYEATHPLAEAHLDWENAVAAVTEEHKVARAQVYAALNTHSTVNKLLKEWPEVAPFVNQKANAPTHPVPAIPVVQLNSLLDLPVEEKEAA